VPDIERDVVVALTGMHLLREFVVFTGTESKRYITHSEKVAEIYEYDMETYGHPSTFGSHIFSPRPNNSNMTFGFRLERGVSKRCGRL